MKKAKSPIVRFVATSVVVSDSNPSFLLVGFADMRNDKCREAFHFQRAYEFDDQDRALGMASVYAERTGKNQGGYGGVERVELRRDQVHIHLCGDVAKRMKTSEVQISFDISPEEYSRLRQALRTIFAGFGTLVEEDE